MKPRPWPTLSSRDVADYRILQVRMDHCQSPRTGDAHDFVVLQASDWVNVIALTPGPDANVVLIEQYRFGTRQVTLEIPGGLIDPGESPLEAGKRELLEETGYTASRFTLLGSVEPNPAIQTNRCFTVLAEDATPTAAQHLDEKEDIGVLVRPLADVPRLFKSGEITHALVWAAFMHLDLHHPPSRR